MKPGIPWSVKGIEQQAREAAKQAARQSGMTIGEWLNTVILDSAEGGDDLERRYRRQPYRPRPLPGVEHGEGEEVTLRLEEIAEQLHTIARNESDTALSRQSSPEDDRRLLTIVERLDAYEQRTSAALGAMQERLEEVSGRLVRDPASQAPQSAEEMPAYRALEGALRNIIEHIEVSETRTCASIRALQERLVETMDQGGGDRAGAAAVGRLEERVAELAERLNGADVAEPVDLAELRESEERLRSLVAEAKQASSPSERAEDVARLKDNLESLNQRFDDMKAEAVSQRHIDELRLEVEQLAATVSQASGHALSDLSGRVQHLETELKSQFSARDEETRREVEALGERIAATEKRLEHLATMEQSVAQLARSLERDGDPLQAGIRASGPSPELKALEEGLKAVRASAEIADRRTQETLHAVHDTLEQIVSKLAELEADSRANDEEPAEELAQTIAEPVTEPVAQEVSEEPVQETAEQLDEQPDEALATEQAREDTASADAGPEAPAVSAEDEAEEETGLSYGVEGFVFPEAAATEDPEPDVRAQPYMEAPEEAHAYAPAEPEGAPVREDYIAAARRAAQMAASRSRNPVTSGFNRFSQRLAGVPAKPADTRDASAPKRGFVSSLFGGLRRNKVAPGEEARPDSRKARRKRLIFAGLVLLAAASAYGAHRAATVPGFLDDLGGMLMGAKASPASSEPEARTDMRPHDALATASIAPTVRTVAQRHEAVAAALPMAIGPQSLRQAAVSGDAVAQFVVAGRYLDGKAVARDEDQAAQWYRRAASQGLAAAQYRLGSMYEHGRGMPLDRQEARVWYEKAAWRGNINAMHNLAVLHTEASAGARRYDLAAEWFRKAAERGLRDSQYNLAVLNEQGLGVPKSPETAVFWYSLAAVQGDSEAAAKAKALEASLPPETAKQVRARLLAWRPLSPNRNANGVPVGDPSWLATS